MGKPFGLESSIGGTDDSAVPPDEDDLLRAAPGAIAKRKKPDLLGEDPAFGLHACFNAKVRTGKIDAEAAPIALYQRPTHRLACETGGAILMDRVRREHWRDHPLACLPRPT